jgi:predicted dehydrogenase
MSGRMRLGLIGAGDVAERDYLPEFDRIADRAEIAAVCARGEARARGAAERFGVPWFTDLERMLADVDLDGVVNLTPIQAHEATTAAALAAGLHVYSEKPLAGSVAAARRLRDEAGRKGVALVVAPSVMVFPQVRLVRRLLDDGVIGEVQTVRGVAFAGRPPWPGYASDPSQFFAEGGGPVVDMAVYPLHAITGLVGAVRRVSAMGLRSRDRFVVDDGPHAGVEVPIVVDDAWALLLELEGGRVGTVETNYTSNGSRAPELELHGTRGTLALSLLDVAAPVEILDADGTWTQHAPAGIERSGGPDHILGVAHLVQVAKDGAPNELSPDHAIHVLDVIESAAASRDGTTRDISTTVGGIRE